MNNPLKQSFFNPNSNKEYANAIALYENAQNELSLLRTNTADAIKNKKREIEKLQRAILSYHENSNIE